jgi:hypothetical protein
MIYFKECKTIEEVKASYKKLAKQHHPDAGGNTTTMQVINSEYAYACAHVIKGAKLSTEETEDALRMSEEYRAAIEQIIHLPGIIVEVVGHWIWVTGNTYPLRKELKAANFFFASKKLAWYFRATEYKTRGGKKSLDEIRRKYGSEVVSHETKSKFIHH